MEKEEVKVEVPFTVSGVTFVPVVKTSLKCCQIRNSVYSFCIKQPVSLVVISPRERKAFSISGEEIPLNQLAEEIPEVAGILEKISK